MIIVTITFIKYNENSIERRTGAYRSSRGKKTLIYTEIKLASGLSLD